MICINTPSSLVGLLPEAVDVYYYITLGNRQELKTLWALGLNGQYLMSFWMFFYCRDGGRITSAFGTDGSSLVRKRGAESEARRAAGWSVKASSGI